MVFQTNPRSLTAFQVSKYLELFETMKISAPMSYADAEAHLGFKRNPSSYQQAVAKARKRGIVIESIRKFGFQRCSGPDIATKRGAYHDRSIRRKSRIASTEMTIALTSNLDKAEMLLASKRASQYQIIINLSSPQRAQSNKRAAQE